MTTIKEIAEMAGVSMTTVYNVLHGNVKKVSKANMEKIQALLDEYHYVPKMGLSALKNNSSKIIGVVIHTSRYYENTVISDTFYSHVIGALEESLRKEGYYMMLYAAEDLEEIFHMSLAWNVDGLIAITFKYHNYIKLKTLINKPIVAIDLIDKEAEDYVNVRKKPTTESKVVGKIYNNSGAKILEKTNNGWYKIVSGNCTGYIKSDFFVTGSSAKSRALDNGYVQAEAKDAIHVRAEASTNSKVVTNVYKNETYTIKKFDKTGEWIKVKIKAGVSGWISAQYANVNINMETAITRKEEKAVSASIRYFDSKTT